MLDIVDADSDIFADMRDRHTQTRASLDQRQFVRIEFRQFRQRTIRELLGGEIVYLARQIAQFAIGIDQAGFFLAGSSVTNQFHDVVS